MNKGSCSQKPSTSNRLAMSRNESSSSKILVMVDSVAQCMFDNVFNMNKKAGSLKMLCALRVRCSLFAVRCAIRKLCEA